MKLKIKFFIFFLVFFLVYISLNAYVTLRLGSLLGIEKNILYLWVGLATLSLPIALFVERLFPNILSRILYTVSAFWIGVLFFMLCSLLIYEVINPFYIIPYAGIIIVIAVSLLSVISAINAIGIVVKKVEIPIENLKKDVTIVQLSDLHIGTVRNSKFLEKIIKKTSELDPDFVMITGDMVDVRTRLTGNLFSNFNRLRAQIYFVTGNHEVYENKDKVHELFNNSKIRVLRNELVNFEEIQIIGIEFSEDKSHIGNELKKLEIDKAKPTILMYHSPEGIEAAKTAGINLQLAGHTHSGQIFPFNFFVRIIFKHIKGLYDLENMFLYVSPGTGTWGPYMRFGSRNEITFLKLITQTHDV